MEQKAIALSKYKIIKELFCGIVAGWTQVIVGQPFDMVKVKLQAKSKFNVGAIEVLKKIIRKEGYVYLYKGTLAPLIAVGGSVAIHMGGYEITKRAISKFIDNDKNGLMKFRGILFSGFFAGTCYGLVICPVENSRIKIQLQKAGNEVFNGSVDAFFKTYQDFGLKGLYRGLFPTMIRDSFGSIGYFGAFEGIMRYCGARKKGPERNKSILIPLLAGSVAGICLWVPIFPIDLIKTRMQIDNLSDLKYKNTYDCYQKLIAKGYGELYKGFSPCILRALAVSSCSFVVFEKLIEQFGLRNDKN